MMYRIISLILISTEFATVVWRTELEHKESQSIVYVTTRWYSLLYSLQLDAVLIFASYVKFRDVTKTESGNTKHREWSNQQIINKVYNVT
jgi:hypothetical protein